MPEVFPKQALSEIASIERGKFSARPRNDPQFYGGSIPFLQTGDIARAGRSITTWEQTLNDRGLKVSKLFSQGTIFMSIAANVGDVAISTFDAACPDSVVAVFPKKNTDPEWLFQTLKLAKNSLAALSTQNAQANLSLEKIMPFKVSVAPLPEQSKIAEILRTWDAAIEKLEALRKAKRRRFEGMAQRLFGPSRAIGRDHVHTNWSHSTFGDVFTERQEKNDSLTSDDVVTVGKYAIRKQSEHFTRSVASKDLSKYWVISPGDFVYDPMSAYYGAIGLFTGQSDGIVSPAYRVIRLSGAVEPDFMVHLLKAHHIRFLLETRSSQGNKEGKRRLLQRGEFEGIEFFLPPIEEQRKITETLSHFLCDLAKTDELLAKLTRQKRGLMQKLLTGEWPVDSGSSEASEASK